jgi:transposase InsO family protein
VAFAVTRAPDVADVLLAAIERFGAPAAVLTDNGCIYTAKHRGGRVVTETPDPAVEAVTERLGDADVGKGRT